MTISREQKKLIWMAVVFTPLCLAIGITIAPFLFMNEIWQSMNDRLKELSEVYVKDGMVMPEHTVAVSYDGLLMQAMKEAFSQMPVRLVISYAVVAIPIAIFSALYFFIYRKNNSIILMVIVWAVVAISISFVLDKFYFTETLTTMDHFIGRIVGITLTFGMTVSALITGILMRKSSKK